MATLQSPGVQVQVIDESFYTPAAPGTVPLIFVASATDKPNGSGTGTAPGTLAANAGKVWTITSQRDLVDTFGTPIFITDSNNNPVHGGEQNEYGLQAAYSLLGVSSKAYIVRADLDLGQLTAKASIPEGAPVSGTYWLDSNDSRFGVKEWDAVNKVFVNKTPLVIDNDNKDTDADFDDMEYEWIPKQSFGTIGSYAMVITSENTNTLWFKNTDNNWVVVGSGVEGTFDGTSDWTSTCWRTSWPVAKSTGLGTITTSTTFGINSQTITLSGDVSASGIADSINAVMYNKGVGARVVSGKLYLYSDKTAKSNGIDEDGKISLDDGSTTISSLGLVEQVYGRVELSMTPHTIYPQYSLNKNPNGSVWVQTTSPNNGSNWLVRLYNGATQSWGTVAAPVYGNPTDATYALDKSGGKNIPVGTLYVETNYHAGVYHSPVWAREANFKLHRRNSTSPTKITGENDVASFEITTPSNTATIVYSFTMSETVANSASPQNTSTIIVATVASSTVTTVTTCTGADIVTAISAAGFENISAKINSDGTLSIQHAVGGEIYFWDDGDVAVMPELGFSAYDVTTKTGTANLYASGNDDANDYIATNWKPLVYQSKQTAPYTTPDDGALWYSSITDEVDIMIHNGTTWVGYQTYLPNTNPTGPIVSALAPIEQSDGTDLVNGDIWISTAGGADSYGKEIYVYNSDTLKWVKQDLTDQTTPDGWLFADARWSTNGYDVEPADIVDMLTSDFLDPDAPDPSLYPMGMRLWNLRRSGFNVKKYVQNYINIYDNDGKNARYNDDPMDGSNDTTPYFADRWVTASANNEDGSGSFGRFAQRKFVISGLKELIDTNAAIRDKDTLVFNLIACPGYPEAIQNMIAFNTDRGLTAFVVGDTPFRLKPNGTDLANWGNNTALAYDNGEEGGVSYDEYMSMFYPSGYTNDNTGNNIVVPPSHMMLRTILNSDAKSYQWFAPAGTRRGGVDNATSVGYIDDEGEFKTVALYEGLRDVLAGVKINPIATFPGIGIVNFGQYTRARNASALDRINVARLVCYLRRQLDILARPFLFEPNDRITRNEIKAAAESLMLELVNQRALYDFIVVCDESNNTPSRIDRSELWLDIAIEPVKAVEFIYIPLRLKNTGEIKAGQ